MTESRTLAEIAEIVDGAVRGDTAVRIDRAASISDATPSSITWISHARYTAQVASSRAGAILAPEDYGPTPMPAILCASLDVAIGKVINLFAPQPPAPAVGIHPTAVVASDSEVADTAAVGPFVVIESGACIEARTILHAGVHIGQDARVGADCRLWNHVVVRERCSLGDRVIIHPSAVIGSDGYGYYRADGRHHKIAHGGTVTIGDDVEIGAGACVDRAKMGCTLIGAGCKIDNLVQVGHNARVGENCLLVAHAAMAGSSTLEDHAILAGHAGVSDHCVVGGGAIGLAHAGIAHDIPPGAVVSGAPATDHKQRLRGVAAAKKIPELIQRVKRLDERVKRLESTEDDL